MTVSRYFQVAVLAACTAVLLPLSTLTGQRPDPRVGGVTVTGVAYDSLRGAPLTNAFVILQERSRSTTSDERGRFHFDSVPPGIYTFAMQHAAFDSLGLSGATARVTVTDGKLPVVLAVPSLAAFWRTACGSIPLPQRDTGIVFGTVRDAVSRQAIREAWVELAWLDLVKLGAEKQSTNISQRRWKSEVQVDPEGGYAICGVPVGTALTLRAFNTAGSTPSIELSGVHEFVRRLDVVLAGNANAAGRRGAVRGTVLDRGGFGLRDIRVKLGSVEAITDRDGHFLLRNVPTGTNQVDLAAVGYNPGSTAVDVFADDTATVTLSTYRLTALDTMRVRAASTAGNVRLQQFEDRRRQGFGSVMDSTQIGRRATLSAAFQGMPGVTVANRSANGRQFDIFLYSTGMGNCLANIMVDGLQQPDSQILNTLSPSDIAAIEVYQQRTTVPTELLRAQQSCGLVVIWTKRAFK